MSEKERYNHDNDDLTSLKTLIDRLKSEKVISFDEARINWELQHNANRIDFIAVAIGVKTEPELQEEIAEKSRASEEKKKEWLSIATDGILTGSSTKSSDFYRLPENEFQAALKLHANSLRHQVRVFGNFLDKWFQLNSLPD